MSNKYGLPLEQPSVQTILPVMTKDGRVYGFYPIAETSFDGTETSFIVSVDEEVSITSVRLQRDTGGGVSEYMTAVFETDTSIVQTSKNSNPTQITRTPWRTASFIEGDDGYYSWWSLPTQTWFHHFGRGMLMNALTFNMNTTGGTVVPAPPPEAESAEMLWRGSVKYEMLYGNCAFFDFNWTVAFKAKSASNPIRIRVISNPSPIPPSRSAPMKATIIGIPQAIGNGGALYDTVRIMKLSDIPKKVGHVDPDVYTFEFEVVDDTDQVTPVTFLLTVE